MTTPNLSMQVNLIETPKKANDARISSNEIDQSEFISDKIFERAKFNRLKTIMSNSVTKEIEVLIGNEQLQNKYTLLDKSSGEI